MLNEKLNQIILDHQSNNESVDDQNIIRAGMILQPSIIKSFMYEINTLEAIIVRLALKQHENRNFDM